MPTCVVPTCKNSAETAKKSHGITFHLFPADEERKSQWTNIIQKARLDEFWKPSKRSVICSRHFEEQYFYCTKSGLKRLKKEAFPNKTVSGATLGQQSQEHDHETSTSYLDADFSNCSPIDDDEEAPASSAEAATGSTRGNVQKSTQIVPDKQLDLKRTDYRCNECNRDIFGSRYVCVQCVDHDVCATCEARGAHALHYVLRVPADKPHREVMAVLEKIREIINIEKHEDQDVPLDEFESIKCEVDTLCDPLQVEDTVKEEPQEFSEFEFTQTDEETTIKGDALPAEPKKRQQRRKRPSSPEKHTDSPPVTLPDTQIRISLNRVTEVIAKRNKTQSSRASSKTIKPNVNAQRTFEQAPGFVVPIVMHNIPRSEDRGVLRPEMHTSPTSSSQALVVSFDPSQPAEDLVIKTELPD